MSRSKVVTWSDATQELHLVSDAEYARTIEFHLLPGNDCQLFIQFGALKDSESVSEYLTLDQAKDIQQWLNVNLK